MRYEWSQTKNQVYISIYAQVQNKDDYVFKENSIFFKNEVIIKELCHKAILIEMESSKNEIQFCLTKVESRRWNRLCKDDKPCEFTHFKFDIDIKDSEKIGDYSDVSVESMLCDIYARGNADQRRAMNRSFLESNFSALTCNWKDVANENSIYVRDYGSKKDSTEHTYTDSPDILVYPVKHIHENQKG